PPNLSAPRNSLSLLHQLSNPTVGRQLGTNRRRCLLSLLSSPLLLLLLVLLLLLLLLLPLLLALLSTILLLCHLHQHLLLLLLLLPRLLLLVLLVRVPQPFRHFCPSRDECSVRRRRGRRPFPDGGARHHSALLRVL